MKLGFVYPQTELDGTAGAARDRHRGRGARLRLHRVLRPRRRRRARRSRTSAHWPLHRARPVPRSTRCAERTSPRSPSASSWPRPCSCSRNARRCWWRAKWPTSTCSRVGVVRLGVGTGWNWVEYESLGIDFSTGDDASKSRSHVLRALWTERLVTFHGTFHDLERMAVNPRPAAAIPIWIGGFDGACVPPGRDGVGDGFTFGGDFDRAVRCLDRIRGYLAEAGRTADGFGAEFIVQSPRTDEVGGTGRPLAAGGRHASVGRHHEHGARTSSAAHLDLRRVVPGADRSRARPNCDGIGLAGTRYSESQGGIDGRGIDPPWRRLARNAGRITTRSGRDVLR